MKPLGFVLGAVTGAAATLLLTREGRRARPVAKAALKTAMMAYHHARVQGAELAEAAEDLFAEAKAEAAAEIFAAAMAAAQAQAAAQAEAAARAEAAAKKAEETAKTGSQPADDGAASAAAEPPRSAAENVPT